MSTPRRIRDSKPSLRGQGEQRDGRAAPETGLFGVRDSLAVGGMWEEEEAREVDGEEEEELEEGKDEKDCTEDAEGGELVRELVEKDREDAM